MPEPRAAGTDRELLAELALRRRHRYRQAREARRALAPGRLSVSAARRWAQERGFDLRITGVDKHATTLELAKEHLAGWRGVTLVRAEALELDCLLIDDPSLARVHAEAKEASQERRP